MSCLLDVSCRQVLRIHSLNVFAEVLSTSCGKSITVQSPVGVVASNHMYKVIPSCLNCSLILTTEEGYQLTAMFHTFGTETGQGGACSKNRLDVYSGAMPVKEDLLSSKWQQWRL